MVVLRCNVRRVFGIWFKDFVDILRDLKFYFLFQNQKISKTYNKNRIYQRAVKTFNISDIFLYVTIKHMRVTRNFMTKLTKIEIEKALENSVWHYGNEILYKMCQDNFGHIKNEYILAKVLFIGRIYAAAIERRKTENNDINDNFYIDSVGPTFKNSDIDKYLNKLKSLEIVEIKDIKDCLEAHFYLIKTINTITNLNKRSFVSKYLHFHLPELFYIYDTRAVGALRKFITKVPNDLTFNLDFQNIDLQYAKFYCKCFELKRQTKSEYNIELTNRHLDNLLIETANLKNSITKKTK